MSLEPDECYIIGADQRAARPDLAIDVVWTHGGLDKLEIYRRLCVPEVWRWQEGVITIHALHGDNYQEADHSAQLPGSTSACCSDRHRSLLYRGGSLHASSAIGALQLSSSAS